jgi:hypothetical protein
MMIIDDLIGPVSGLLDRIVPDPAARDAAKAELIRLGQTGDLDSLKAQIGAALSQAPPPADPWTSRARPGFLYVMYALLLWSVPMGVIAAFRPATAQAIAAGMTAYLNGLPEPLYTLFGTGYLGYTVARTWGKTKGVEK